LLRLGSFPNSLYTQQKVRVETETGGWEGKLLGKVTHHPTTGHFLRTVYSISSRALVPSQAQPLAPANP
jgi:hypothetical protein